MDFHGLMISVDRQFTHRMVQTVLTVALVALVLAALWVARSALMSIRAERATQRAARTRATRATVSTVCTMRCVNWRSTEIMSPWKSIVAATPQARASLAQEIAREVGHQGVDAT